MLTESGGSLCKKKKKQDGKRHSQIEEATLLLNQGRITAATFLSRMVYEANEVCVDMVTKLDIFQEAEDSDCEMSSEEEVAIDVESSTGHDCVVCLQAFKRCNDTMQASKDLYGVQFKIVS